MNQVDGSVPAPSLQCHVWAILFLNFSYTNRYKYKRQQHGQKIIKWLNMFDYQNIKNSMPTNG